MRHESEGPSSSPDLFALVFETRARDYTELVTGRFGVADVAAQFADARQRTAVSARSVRQDDRPAGRMTLLAAE